MDDTKNAIKAYLVMGGMFAASLAVTYLSYKIFGKIVAKEVVKLL